MLIAFHQRVTLIEKDFSEEEGMKEKEILADLKRDLLSASESPTTVKILALHSFITVSDSTKRAKELLLIVC